MRNPGVHGRPPGPPAPAAPAPGRRALMAFTFADGLWVAASALVLLLFWNELAPLARILVIAAAVVVDVFAMLQFRAAGGLRSQTA